MALIRNAPDEVARQVARLLAWPWADLTQTERHAALLAAYCFGADLAETALEDGDTEAIGCPADYRRVCIKFSLDVGVIGETETGLWRTISDPRLQAFASGFWDRRRGR
jgi:hypothetical protein